MAKDKKIHVTQVKSTIEARKKHTATIKGLGLRKINHTVELVDSPEVRGMINSVNYLLRVEN